MKHTDELFSSPQTHVPYPNPITSAVNSRESIVSLLRGAFVVPVISFLGRQGLLEMLPYGGVVEVYKQNNKVQALFEYLVAIGLTEEKSHGEFVATELGRKVFARYGVFSIIDSYSPFFSDLQWTIDDGEPPQIFRARNVVGSGQIHSRKYFPRALDCMVGKNYKLMLDIGCGDGAFLESALLKFGTLCGIGIDLSYESVCAASERLRRMNTDGRATIIQWDAVDVPGWVRAANVNDKKPDIITLWFLLHEIAGSGLGAVSTFMHMLHQVTDGADVCVCELFSFPSSVLAGCKHLSAMPEFALFHRLSGQRLMSKQELVSIISASPYEIADAVPLDLLKSGAADGTSAGLIFLRSRLHSQPVKTL